MTILSDDDIAVGWEGYLEPLGQTYGEKPQVKVSLGEPSWWPAEPGLKATVQTRFGPIPLGTPEAATSQGWLVREE